MRNKKIILAITGSIAAYKAAFLTRLLIKQGAEVQVIMTPSAAAFITPLTLATLSKRDVHTEVISEESWNNHVELGLWADAMVIAPATANTLAKLAAGICDSMVGAVYLSAKCPVFFAPAMDLDMWKHPASKKNLETLKSFGNEIIPVGHGELASGLVGDGRMAEPEDIVDFLNDHFNKKLSLKGKVAVVTAGPTYEAIDPVRFIGNRSTGKMGIAIAEKLAERGATVYLVLGPTSQKTEQEGVETIRVTSAEEMYQAATKHFKKADVAIMAAAVADYRPKSFSNKKIKKKEGDMAVELERTKDIAKQLGQVKKKGQLTIGFALETNNEKANAKGKVERKNFDFIVLNSLRDKGAGFGHDTNKVTFIFKDGTEKALELKLKTEVAVDIVDEIEGLLF